jgi:fructose 1,6-bisphosphatase
MHEKGEQNHETHKLSWNRFKEAADKALELKLYGAEQDLLKATFSDAVTGQE